MGKLQDVISELANKALDENGMIYNDEIISRINEDFYTLAKTTVNAYISKTKKALKSNPNITVIESIDDYKLPENNEDNSNSVNTSSFYNNQNYIKKMLSVKRYSIEEERNAIAMYQDPSLSPEKKKALRKEIVEHYMYIPCQISIKYINSYPDADLVNEGFFGLVKALDMFDLSRGLRFSTYAVNWVKQCIWSYIHDDKNIRIPYQITVLQRKIERITSDYIQKNGKKPTFEELKRLSGLSSTKIKSVLKYHTETLSLDDVKNDEEDASIGYYIADTNSQSVEEQIEQKSIREIFNSFVQNLSERDRYILVEYLGLNDSGETKTFEQIAKEIAPLNIKKGVAKELSRERVRQLYLYRLQQLRHSAEASLLKDYWDENL